MDSVTVRIGHLAFDHVNYDAESDVLYLHVGSPRRSEGEETPEGHAVHFAPGTREIVALTLVNPRWLLHRDGCVTVTVPEVVQATADDLGLGLTAA